MRVCTHMQYNRARGEKKSKTRMEGGVIVSDARVGNALRDSRNKVTRIEFRRQLACFATISPFTFVCEKVMLNSEGD